MTMYPGFLAGLADEGPSARYIIEKAAVGFDVTVEELAGPGRGRPLVSYRQITMAVVRRETGASLPAIGRMFNRDHTTVMYGVERVEKVPALRAAARALQAEVKREWKAHHQQQYNQSAYAMVEFN